VMGGMNAVVVLALLMVPTFYVVVQRLFGARETPTDTPSPASAAEKTTESAPVH
jgi:hypothetical protein